MLDALEEKGLPIPLRYYAAAGGLTIEQIERDLQDELEIRKKIKQLILIQKAVRFLLM